ncbi:MAG: substrate-binding domain-containing protein [Paracoccaceae bacterium]
MAATAVGLGIWAWIALLDPVVLRIAMGRDHSALTPLISDWADQAGVTVDLRLEGSAMLAAQLWQGGAERIDAIWPSDSIWLDMETSAGTAPSHLYDVAPIFDEGIVLALHPKAAQNLIWTDPRGVTMGMIAQAITAGGLRVAMPSASKTHVGAATYMGFIQGLSGTPANVTPAHLNDPALQARVQSVLVKVDQPAAMTADLMSQNSLYDAVFLTESMARLANRDLEAGGHSPWRLIMPVDALGDADHPLALMDHGNGRKLWHLQNLRDHLLSPSVQAQLSRGAEPTNAPAAVAEPQPRPLGGFARASPHKPALRLPDPTTIRAHVMRKALALYQSDLRKPTLRVWVLDVSGSMQGAPLEDLKSAMTQILTGHSSTTRILTGLGQNHPQEDRPKGLARFGPRWADARDVVQAQGLASIQASTQDMPSARDVTIVVPFRQRPGAAFDVRGHDEHALRDALYRIETLHAGGGSDLYMALCRAMDAITPYLAGATGLSGYQTSVIVVTDGVSPMDKRDAFFRDYFAKGLSGQRPGDVSGRVSVHTVALGLADRDQLRDLSAATGGLMLEGGPDLFATFRRIQALH